MNNFNTKPLLFKRITEEEQQLPNITQQQNPMYNSFQYPSTKPLLFERLPEINIRTNHLGERKVMKCGDEAVIIGYRSADDIWVLFPSTGETVISNYNVFTRGQIKSHFYPSLCGVGIVGFEKTSTSDGKHLPSYETWQSMIKRCYSEKLQAKHPTYIGCTVCDEWKYYSNFKKWYDENYYNCNDGYRVSLDKDILVKGNKVYSPETCVFVSAFINSLLVKPYTYNRKNSLPRGVSYIQAEKKYMATCSLLDFDTMKTKNKNLGLYRDPDEAFIAYKIAKEDNIKKIAEYYKSRIPEKLYNALMNYTVEADD